MKVQINTSLLRERARAIRGEYAKHLVSGHAPKNQDLYEKISDLSLLLDHRLEYRPQKITELWEELERAIADWDACHPDCDSGSFS
jgi:hypothetical protein